MENLISISPRAIYRMVCVAIAALMVVAGFPFVFKGNAKAATQLSYRSIQMSDSGPSGNTVATTGVGSGTNVTYRVSFTAFTRAQSMVIDFCQEDPIINDTCTHPNGMLTQTGVTLDGVSGQVNNTDWQFASGGSAGVDGQIKIFNNGASTSDIGDDLNPPTTTSSPQVIDFTGITNPSDDGATPTPHQQFTFYARIYTYSNNTFGDYASPTNTGYCTSSCGAGAVQDYGGIALGIVNTVSITARVQEQLTYCVTAADFSQWTTEGCGNNNVSGNPPIFNLGHVNSGGSTRVLDDTVTDVSFMYSELTTNALHGVVINMHHKYNCAGLSADGGSTCNIAAVPDFDGGTAGYQPGPIDSTHKALFGLFLTDGATRNGGTGTMPATASYNGFDGTTAHNTLPTVDPITGNITAAGDVYYGMDNTTTRFNIGNAVSDPVQNTFGSTVASSTGPVANMDHQYVFGARADITTPAGIYNAIFSFIATGTF